VFRSKFTLSWRALARALVIGPCGGLGGLEAEVSEGHPTSRRKTFKDEVGENTRSFQDVAFYLYI
jgi:hypothetical protein